MVLDASIVSLLQRRAYEHPDRHAYTFLESGEFEAESLTYAQLDRRARAVAALLQSHGLSGQCVALVLPSGLDYPASLFGCMYAGALAVPVFPPRIGLGVPDRTTRRLRAICSDARPAAILTNAAVMSRLDEILTLAPELRVIRWISVADIDVALAQQWRGVATSNNDVAYLQYTSGSTATPRGVILTHGNLLHEAAALSDLHRYTPESSSFIWLPLFHDWGIVEGIIQPLFEMIHCHLMSPEAMVQHPVRWLRGISRYRCTHSSSPNFALELCLRKTTPEQRLSLDLSSWRAFPNAAEPIRQHTLDRFAETFAACGFRSDAYIASYGLAEATLVICSRRRSHVSFCSVSSDELGRNRIVDAAPGERKVSVLASCGTSVLGTRIEIVDPNTAIRCPPGRVGEIWVMGGSVARGYWNAPDASAATFHAYLKETGEGPFLRSGDLGFVRDGELYMAGRHKDLLIINGENHYPQDIEHTVERCTSIVRAGCGAVFSVDVGEEERVVVVYEVTNATMPDAAFVAGTIRDAVSKHHDLALYAIAFITPGTIPKTSSGKIQRSECRNNFLAGAFDIVADWRMPERHPGKSGDPEAEIGPPRGIKKADIEAWLFTWLERNLHVSSAELDPGALFSSFGMSSRHALGLSGDMANWLGRAVSPVVVYEHPTIDALSRHLAIEIRPTVANLKAAPTRTLGPEPVAIIGMACRFPGAGSPEALWQLLLNGFDAIAEVPANRWDNVAFYDPDPEAPGKIYTRHGGFIEDIDKFDAALFGISAREAIGLDPQQRLVAELSWEALERAGQGRDPRTRRRTGVFIGIGNSDYGRMRMAAPTQIDGYTATGSASSVAAGRVSYLLGLDGPSVAVDTACSSSLMAVHLACQSLRTGECDMALAGGVNAILSPYLSIGLCKAGMLSPEGRCKSFSAEADGYVRSEGCGVVVLKLLRDALADGDSVLAVIRGSAVNQDGRSNGLTAPNPSAQQAVIRAALAQTGVPPLRVSYIEAHGTGTALGDPIEINAIAAALAVGRCKGDPLIVGSVKTNIGHLEAASGIAGLFKVVLSMQGGTIPANLHFRTPSPHIAWGDLPVTIPTQPVKWRRGDVPRLAGVSSFGFSGTNVHVVVEEAPTLPVHTCDDGRPHLLRLSAATGAALRELATRFERHLAEYPSLSLADVCFTAGVARAVLPHRLGVVANSEIELRKGLAAFASGNIGAGHVGHVTGSRQPGVVFLFTGQGSQYVEMGRQLYEMHPRFRQVLDACNEMLQSKLASVYGRAPLLTALQSRPDQAVKLNAAIYAQPALFALQIALAEVWRSWKVEPVAVMGHSLGEYAAACVAGALTWEEGLLLVAERARLMQALPRRGAMAAVFADEATVAAALAPHSAHVAIAAVNGPRNIVISGDKSAVDDLLAGFGAAGFETRRLSVSHAFHSPVMDDALDGLERAAQQVVSCTPRITLISNLTGKAVNTAPSAASWRRQAREPVRFADGMSCLARQGWRLFLEIGPGAVLSGLGPGCIDDTDAVFIPSLKEGEDDWGMMLNAAAALSTRGVDVDMAGIAAPLRPRRVRLPTYPFERRRYWGIAPPRAAEAAQSSGADAADAEIPASQREGGSAAPGPPDADLERIPTPAGVLAALPQEQRLLIERYLRLHVASMLMAAPDHIDPVQSLTHLGFDSILALKLRNRIQADFGLQVPMAKLLQRANIRSLVELIEQRVAPTAMQADVVTLLGRDAVSPMRSFPLSASQHSLWVLHQISSNQAAYSIPTAIRLRGRLDVSALERGLTELQRRHEVLRTTFRVIDGEPRQVPSNPAPAFLPVLDLRSLPEGKARSEAQRLMVEEAKRPLDPTAGQVMRTTLLRIADAECILVVVMHHIVADGWSILGILLPELAALYQAFSTGKPSPLSEPQLQYADFAVWQQAQHTVDGLSRESAYWRETLAGAAFSLSIPTDRRRPATFRNHGQRLTRTLAVELTDRLTALSKECEVTLFVVMLAAMKMLLFRLTGQRDISVGTTITTRSRPEFEVVVGDFTNHLPLRAEVSGNLSAREFIARIERAAMDAFANGGCPFDKIVEAVNPVRKGNRNPLYDIAFVMHTFTGRTPGTWNAGALQLSLVPPLAQVDNETSELDLIFELAETPGGIVLECEFDTDLFERQTIERILDGYSTLLAGVVADPAQRISALPVLSETERGLILSQWNRPDRDFPVPLSVHEMFESSALCNAESVAVKCGETWLSYAELNSRANRLAHRLRRGGVRPGRIVGIFMERSIEFVVAIIATLKAGGAYLALDPRYPADRLAFMLKDSAASILLAQTSLGDRLPVFDRQVLLFTPEFETVAGEPQTDPDPSATPGDPAYLLYTSGSTGTPKGVLIPHANIARLFSATRTLFAFDEQDVWTLFHSFSFDFSVWEMWGAFLHGGRLVIVPYEVSRSPEAFQRLLCAEGVTILNQTPSAFRQLVAEENPAGALVRPPIRLVIFGGETLDLQNLRHLPAWYAQVRPRMINMYGITETTVHVTFRQFDPLEPERDYGSVVGVPIPDMQVYVLDALHDLVPVGARGELCIGGSGLALGYLNQPGLTAERFIPNPFSPTPGARLYRSGDTGCHRHDGSISFHGRIDHQVKIRGFRVELGEIEAVLKQHETVADAAVALDESVASGRLVAYVVPAQRGVAPDAGDGGGAAEIEADQLAHWRTVFDETYREGAPTADPTFNIAGWKSSYTGEMIPRQEMKEWVDRTVSQILERRPAQILEIGCGTGLLLFRVASRCARYIGTDFSGAALQYVGRQLAGLGPNHRCVELLERAADDFEGIATRSFDLVVLNSITQLFPSTDYLTRVLEGAVEAAKPGGAIFVGDVRSLALIDAFHISVVLHNAAPSTSFSAIRTMAQRRKEREHELVIDPAFFIALKQRQPSIGLVEIRVKRGRFHNELTRFRYDVVLHVTDEPIPPVAEYAEVDWSKDRLTIARLERRLKMNRFPVLLVRRIPNARLASAVTALDPALDESADADSARLAHASGIEPEDLFDLGERLSYAVHVTWSGTGADGLIEVLFRRRNSDVSEKAALSLLEPKVVAPSSRFANAPSQQHVARRLEPALREHLGRILPEHMVPTVFVIQQNLPLTANGKLDRVRLPKPDFERPNVREAFVPPGNSVENTLVSVFSQVLNVNRIGVNDNFFELGGHSLLATQVVSRVRKIFRLEMPLRAIFETPTVKHLSAIIISELARKINDVALTAIEASVFDEPQAQIGSRP
ncbi:amino acid adenylation domain-containing protein (plasmid) [Bradyrhizobium sp. LCT2]|uniref:non-ribosomal peptide synthetase/type I polyketide synthase n=1 Tax=Bradyrhizobium sp. LCT2 TaxID=2493093 RepID=UPI001373DB5B|nr:non-ribosomal peptide synthetase/type I polyketide synthase [Bradyrhizobium sp. LCT2]QHP66041.1 amino acid adenylation domain-containing protein [Bradyrhizobium sp. LCT2]